MHPVLFQLGPITVYSYGLFAALALTVGFLVAHTRASKFGLQAAAVDDMVFFIFLAGIAGARGLYVWENWADYHHNLWRVWDIREGGLVWYGGFLAASFFGIAYVYMRRWPVLKIFDFFAPAIALTQAIGRVGCFFNGCCYGRPAAWGVWPVQLFEATFLFLLSLVLFSLATKSRREGTLFAFYVLGAAGARFLFEFIRGDQTPLGLLSIPQWTSLVLIAGAFFFISYARKV